jgi:hypothetical protein
MPRQYFAADAASAPSAAITWESSFTNVEVAFGQSIVTRIPNADPLRTTGLQGQGPDGANLTLHLVNGPNGEQFVMTRNGTPMIGGSVAWVASGTPLDYPAVSSWAPAGVATVSATQVSMGQASEGQRKTMTWARTWLGLIGGLNLLGSIPYLTGSSAIKDQLNQSGASVEVDTGLIRAIGIVAALIALTVLATGIMAKGTRAKVMFAVGTVILSLFTLGGFLIGAKGAGAFLGVAVLMGLAARQSFKAYKVAKKLNP